MSAWTAYVLYMRTGVTALMKVTTNISFFLAFMATFSPMLDKTIETKFTNPSSFIWASIFIKGVRGCLTITLFIMNNSPNDFYIALFFLFTNMLGYFYFDLGGFIAPD